MLKIKNYTPGFLRRLDNYLLIRYPLLFASRIVYVLIYCVMMVAFGLIGFSIMPVRAFLMPDAGRAIFGFLIIAGTGLVAYINTQRLLDMVYYHGSGKRFYSLKAVALFFVVFLLFSQLVALPYAYVNYRISKTFTEDRLPPARLNLTPTNPFNPQVDTLPFISSTCSVGDTNLVQYFGLPAKARDQVVFSLGRNLFYNILNLRFGRDSIGSWAHCIIPRSRDALSPGDSLQLYYGSLSHIDSFYSDIYKCMVYSGKLRGRVSYSGSVQPRDTSIGRYYFYSRLDHKYVSSDSGDIQLRLLTEHILQRDKITADTTAVDRQETVRWIEYEYLFASIERFRWKHILYSAAFDGCILAMALLFGFTFIKFFGLELFLTNLSLPAVFLCFLVFQSSFRDTLISLYPRFLWGLLVMLALLPFLRRRRTAEIVVLQLICTAVLVIILRFPFDMYHPAPGTPHFVDSPIAIITPLKWLIIPIPVAIVLSAVLFDKLCRVYVKPEG